MDRVILTGGTCVYYDAQRCDWAFDYADVLVENGVVHRILPRKATAPSQGVFQLNGALVLPAFTNAHTHAFEYALKGFKSGRSIDDAHPSWFWDIYRAFPSELALLSAELHYAENVAAGVTVIGDVLRADLDPAPFEAALVRTGVRGRVFSSQPGGAAIDLGHEGHASFLDRVDRARQAAPSTVMHLHYLESAARREQSRARFGGSLPTIMRAAGLLDRQWILSHCGAADATDLQLFEADRTLVVPTPIAEARLHEPSVDTDMLHALGFELGFGSDGPCYNPRVDLFEELRLFRALHPTAALSHLAYRATTGSRRWLLDDADDDGLGDVVILDGKSIGLTPMVSAPYDNRLDNIFSAACTSSIVGTVGAGRLLYWRGEWLDHDVRGRQVLLQKRLAEFLSDTVKGTVHETPL